MFQTNSIVATEPKAGDRVRLAIAGHPFKSDERTSVGPVLRHKAQRLDVDEVLTRSLPKVASEQSIAGTILSLGRRSSVGGDAGNE